MKIIYHVTISRIPAYNDEFGHHFAEYSALGHFTVQNLKEIPDAVKAFMEDATGESDHNIYYTDETSILQPMGKVYSGIDTNGEQKVCVGLWHTCREYTAYLHGFA